MSSSPHLGFAVKQLAPIDLQSSLLSGKKENGSNLTESPAQLKRNLSSHHNGLWDSCFSQAHIFVRISYFTALGCIVFATFKLFGMKLGRTRASSHWASTRANSNIEWTADSSVDYNIGSAYIRGGNIADRLQKLLGMVKIKHLHLSNAGNRKSLHSASTSPSSLLKYKMPMPVEEAEALVKQWQTVKAEVLGPSHQVHRLAQVLDESMLEQVVHVMLCIVYFINCCCLNN